MLTRLTAGKGFYIGAMFDEAATRYANREIILDRPTDVAPERGTDFTYAGLADLVADLSARLWAVGVRPSERVCIQKTHNFDIVALACAVARIGAVPALLSPSLDGDTATELVRRLDRPWVLTDAQTLAGPLSGIGSVARDVLVAAGGPVPGTTDLGEYANAPRRPAVRLHPSQPTMITHSSGTTGTPKLAVHTAARLWHRLVPQQLWSWPMRNETVAFCLTFVHSRFYHALGVFLRYGSRIVIAADHDPVTIGPLFARTRPGVVETHPNTFVDWEDLVRAAGRPLAGVRYYTSTFDAMHPRTIERLLRASRRRFPVFLQFYGQSETGPVAGRWYTKRGIARADGRCVGLPLPGFVRLRVIGPDGRPVRRGETGYIVVKHRARAITYLGEEKRYGEQLSRGWWRMGDMGYRGRYGLLYLLDREVDRIENMDSNLAAEDVLMSRLEELREVVIVRGADGTAVPVVATRDEAPLDTERWTRAAADFPGLGAPVQMPFDEMPRTATWKIRRSVLERMLEAS